MRVSIGVMAVRVFLLLTGVLLVHGSEIVLSPPRNQFIAENSQDNVTYRCNVSDQSTSRMAVWTIQGRQNPVDQRFRDLGIFIDDVVEPSVIEVTITQMARLSFLNDSSSPTPNITVQCSSFSFAGALPITEAGDEFNVTTFGPPLSPARLRLQPDPRNVAQLVFSWVAPKGSFAAVEVNYTVNITGSSLSLSEVTNQTFIILANDLDSVCEAHVFSVFASNAAGSGPVAMDMETIPISPIITDINERFLVSDVSLSSMITLTLFVPPALACNDRFPILNYSLGIFSLELTPELFVPFEFNQEGEDFTGSLPVTGLQRDQVYMVFIEACISITCRQSQFRLLRTTDVQEASITFFENNIFLNCTFASNSDASGCEFQLLLVNNATESFFLSRSNSSVTQCNQTMNQADAYVRLIAVDREADETSTARSPIDLTPLIIEDADMYMTVTGCSIPEPFSIPEPPSIPEPQDPLSGGAIAGIVIAVFIAGVVVLGVILLVICYLIMTGQWFKLKEKDDEKLVVDFEKTLLMSDYKPKKKSKSGSGHNSPDIGDDGTEMAVAVSAQESDIGDDGTEMAVAVSAQESAAEPLKVGIEMYDMAVAATNPQNAFTLDIHSDKNKVKLHLNRALIKKVLQDNKLNTVDRRKARRQTSVSKQHLLPVQGEVRVKVKEEGN